MRAPEFTGERYIPGQGGSQIAYEHLHRYLFALRWVSSKAVLDVATGTGYGAALLARAAQLVYALEIDRPTVDFARSSTGSRNILYVQGDATRLPFRPKSMDVVVGYEILEHVRGPDSMIAEFAKVLAPGGIALISTPNKTVYSDARDYRNPYHVREFYPDEFLALIQSHFRCARLYYQQVRAGSLIRSGGSLTDHGEVYEQPLPLPARQGAEPMYMIAVCSDEDSVVSDGGPSVYMDPTDAIFDEYAEELRRLNHKIEELGRWGKELESTLGRRDETIRNLMQHVESLNLRIRDLEMEIHGRDSTIQGLQGEFQERTRWALSLQETINERDATIEEANRRIESAEREITDLRYYIASLKSLLTYRLLARLGLFPK